MSIDDFRGGLEQKNFSYEESNIGVDSYPDWGKEFSAYTSELYGEDFGEKNHRSCMIRWKSGRSVDPRLLTLLESFREIYDKRRDFFKKIFPKSQEDFVDVFKKTSTASRKNKEVRSFRTIGRSLSLGSRRPQRFKVRTPNVIVVAGGDGKGDQIQGETASKTSNR
ncbi:Hypothetical predicted protein [Olea europaea subsp. europaea]|uniref:Uncharacterized protein n=1 Tax=Olea europaea subsp. europaea TaxID=158383 RepID=A0A8S0VM31_OLEEU|nr:Hypothetical predicted protein [Olea europaea subsp. europaea]